jgi:hypothetical protein
MMASTPFLSIGLKFTLNTYVLGDFKSHNQPVFGAANFSQKILDGQFPPKSIWLPLLDPDNVRPNHLRPAVFWGLVMNESKFGANMSKRFPQSIPMIMAALIATTILGDVSLGQLRLPFRGNPSEAQRPADNGTSLKLNERCGPWLVMCASFSGDAGQRKAENLAQELRRKHAMNAYVYQHVFDHTEKLINSAIPTWSIDEKSNSNHHVVQTKMKPATESYIQEYAVLVGDFPSVEDARAQRMLKKIKSLSSDSIEASLTGAEESGLSAERIRKWRHEPDSSIGHRGANQSVLGAAFLMANPTLPDEYFKKETVDKLVLKMNKGVKHSLLKNQGVYTVRVASFQGESSFDIGTIEAKKREFNLMKKNNQSLRKSKLVEAAKKAHILTNEFRKIGVDAYEFHDRCESYVCIGSFDWIAREDENGNRIQNPEVVALIKKYRGKPQTMPNLPPGYQPYVLPSLVNKKITCDVQPIPVLIPKVAHKSTAAKLLDRWN